jgi:hypothetical protein
VKKPPRKNVTGPHAHVALTALLADGWETVSTNTLVLARIDHEEPYGLRTGCCPDPGDGPADLWAHLQDRPR